MSETETPEAESERASVPRPHWLVIAIALVTLMIALLAVVMSDSGDGESAKPPRPNVTGGRGLIYGKFNPSGVDSTGEGFTSVPPTLPFVVTTTTAASGVVPIGSNTPNSITTTTRPGSTAPTTAPAGTAAPTTQAPTTETTVAPTTTTTTTVPEVSFWAVMGANNPKLSTFSKSGRLISELAAAPATTSISRSSQTGMMAGIDPTGGDGRGPIVIFDGTGVERGMLGGEFSVARLGPSGQSIAAILHNSGPQLLTMSVNGTNARGWAIPDGQVPASVDYIGAESWLAVSTTSGKYGVLSLTDGNWYEIQTAVPVGINLRVSPDQYSVVFESNGTLYRQNYDGANLVAIGRGSSPVWESDASILFSHAGQVYRSRPDGTGRVQLTRVGAYAPVA